MTPRRLPAALAAGAVVLSPAAALTVPLAASTLVAAPVAGAHSVLVSSDPADGTTLQRGPQRVTLTFNEEINPNFATVTLVDQGRSNLVTADPVVAGPTVAVDVPVVGAGEYTVGYRVTSADGHVVQGSSRFTVAGGGSTTTSPRPIDTSPTVADDSGDTTAALIGVGVLAVALIAGAWFLVRRRRH